jgi:hypothetical protein
MMRYIVVDGQNNIVNAILWDGKTPYDPGTEMRLIQDEGGLYQIGSLYAGEL